MKPFDKFHQDASFIHPRRFCPKGPHLRQIIAITVQIERETVRKTESSTV